MWMVLSAGCLSLSFLFLKMGLFHLSYLFLLFLRFAIPLALVVLWLTCTGKWMEIAATKGLKIEIARAGCVLVSQYGIAIYLIQNSLLNATVILNAAPLFIPLIEWIFLKERPGKSTIVGALLAFLGVLLVLQPDRSLFTAMGAIALLAALGQAGSQVLYGLKTKQETILTTLFYLFLFTTVISFLIYLFFESPSLGVHKGRAWLLLILAMGIATLLNQYFRGLAYRSGRPSTLATFLFFSVFVSTILDWLVFKTVPTLLALLGACFILLGGILKLYLRARILKKKKGSSKK